LNKKAEVEARFIKGLNIMVPEIDFGESKMREFAREKLRETAYHEAGHAAVHAFMGDEYGHLTTISIIPENDGICGKTKGRVMRARMPTLEYYEAKKRRGFNISWELKRKIIWLLAGTVAGQIALNEPEQIFDADGDWADWQAEGYKSEEEWLRHDLGQCQQVISMVESNLWPAFRILTTMEKWTRELLQQGNVWRVVELLAERLIEKGVIEFDEYNEIASPIVFGQFHETVWKKRFLTPAEKWLKNSGMIHTA
jgi:hypothetical protein